MATIIGTDLQLYILDATVWRPIACASTAGITETTNTIESNTKCGFTVSPGSQPPITLNVDGEYIDTTSVGGETTKASHDYLRGIKTNKTLVSLKLDSGLEDDPAYYVTNAFITDLSATFDNDAPANFSVTFTANADAVSFVDPNA